MKAEVRSIDAVRDWHATLTTYGDSLSEALSGVEVEIRRGFEYLNEQLGRWQRAVRDLEAEVAQAKAELANKKFPDWSGREPDTTLEEKVLRRARARLEYAEDQIVKIRSWIGRLPKMIDEVYRGPAHRLVNFLEGELPRGLAVLDRQITSLENYAGLRTDYAPAPSVTSLPIAPPPPAKPTTERPDEGGEQR